MPRSPLKRSLSESPVLLPASLPQVPSTPTSKRSKLAAPSTPDNGPTSTSHAAPLSASAKSKLAILSTSYGHSPFPSFSRPTPEECQQVHDLLSSVHGVPRRPSILIDRPGAPAGCGEVPSVLDALIRTLLSQNTSSRNSTNAKEGMDRVYGRANYRAVLDGGAGRLEEAIRSGGLAKKKAAAIIGVLQWLDEREEGKGELSMQYLREMVCRFGLSLARAELTHTPPGRAGRPRRHGGAMQPPLGGSENSLLRPPLLPRSRLVRSGHVSPAAVFPPPPRKPPRSPLARAGTSTASPSPSPGSPPPPRATKPFSTSTRSSPRSSNMACTPSLSRTAEGARIVRRMELLVWILSRRVRLLG